jgi:two-component system chemotaxis response regulator CheY
MVNTNTALVVDDSKSMRQMVSFTLRESGFDIIEGSNGQEALNNVANKQVSVIITDLNMPVMDGMTLLRELRARPEFKFTPILMLTTESHESKKQEGRAAGATGWITKPFNPEQLMQVVNKVVR